jgi:hypothetical protein
MDGNDIYRNKFLLGIIFLQRLEITIGHNELMRQRKKEWSEKKKNHNPKKQNKHRNNKKKRKSYISFLPLLRLLFPSFDLFQVLFVCFSFLYFIKFILLTNRQITVRKMIYAYESRHIRSQITSLAS